MGTELQTIIPTDNLEELEKNMTSWLKLPHKFKLLSDDECMRKYNYTNIDLYNKTKKEILDPDDSMEGTLQEGFIYDSNENVFFNAEELQRLYDYYTQDSNIIIIPTWFTGNIDELNILYNKYLITPSKYKRFSNYYSQILFGYNVPNMYTIISNKLNHENERAKIISPDKILESIDKAVCKNDLRTLMEYKDAYTEHCNSNIADNVIIRESINEAINDLNEMKEPDLSNFKAVPWFVPGERDNLNLLEFYEDENYIQKLKEAYIDFKYNKNETRLLELGWNPSVPLTVESMNYAKQRLSNYIKENTCEIIDVTNIQLQESSNIMKALYKEKDLYPVFIVLSFTNTVFGKVIRFVKKSTYTHAGLSLDSNLKNILTFKYSSNYNGFNFESIKTYTDTYDGALIEVLCLFVDGKSKYKIEQSLEYYIKHQDDTRYGFKNLINILFNKKKEVTEFDKELVCSQFVDHILKLCGIDILKKPNNLVIPQDYATIAVKHPRVYKVYEGLAKLYNEKKIENIIENLFINTRGIKYVNESGKEFSIDINLEPSIVTIPKE